MFRGGTFNADTFDDISKQIRQARKVHFQCVCCLCVSETNKQKKNCICSKLQTWKSPLKLLNKNKFPEHFFFEKRIQE